MRCVTIRIDDIGRDEAASFALIGMLVACGLPCTCLLVPTWLEEATAFYLGCLATRRPRLVELGQHGYAHHNHAPPGQRKYEFGPARPPAAQREDLRQGQAILARRFGALGPTVFSPPHDRLDQATLDALRELGFAVCLGSDRTFTGLTLPAGLASVIYRTDASHRVDSVRTFRGTPACIAELRSQSDDQSCPGLILHPAEFAEPAALAALVAGLDDLRRDGTTFLLASDVAATNGQP